MNLLFYLNNYDMCIDLVISFCTRTKNNCLFLSTHSPSRLLPSLLSGTSIYVYACIRTYPHYYYLLALLAFCRAIMNGRM